MAPGVPDTTTPACVATQIPEQGRLTPEITDGCVGPDEDLASSHPGESVTASATRVIRASSTSVAGDSKGSDSASSREDVRGLTRPPTLTKPGYICDPPIEALALLAPPELQSVKNFSVMRVGVGSVRWLQPVDLSLGANLDHDVIIEPGSVSVYKELDDEDVEDAWHAPLNSPAIVVLENVFYQGSSPSKRRMFPKRVETKTNEMEGASFISYDEITGAWKFAVSSWRGQRPR